MSAQKAKILIVEDDANAGEELSEILTALGFEVSATAASAEEAIASVAQTPPDLVLLDIGIEGARDGIETAEILRTQYRVPVVFLTAYSDPYTLQRAKDAEPYAYLIKPVKVNDLRSTLTLALHRAEKDRSAREQTTWLTAMLDSLSDAVVAVTGTDHITYMNRSAEALFGWTASDAKGLPLSDLPAPASHDGDGIPVQLETLRTTMQDTQGRTLGALIVYKPTLRTKSPTLRPTLPSPSLSLQQAAWPDASGLGVGSSVVASIAQSNSPDSKSGGTRGTELVTRGRTAEAVESPPLSSRQPGTTPGPHSSHAPRSSLMSASDGNHDLRTLAPRVSTRPPQSLMYPGSPQLASLVSGVAQEVNNPLAFVVVNQEYAIQELLKLEASLEASLDAGLLNQHDAQPLPAGARGEGAEARADEFPSGSHRISDTRSTLQNVRSALSDAQIGAARVRTAVAELSQLNPIESRPPPSGAHFRSSAPSQALEAESSLPPTGRTPVSHGKRMLLVDDERPLLEAMARMLGSAHHIVRLTGAGAALELLEQGETFDLILSDVVMPGLDGLQFYAEVQRRFPNATARFAFMTGGVLSSEVRSFLTSGRCPLLLKPFTHEELREFIATCLSVPLHDVAGARPR